MLSNETAKLLHLTQPASTLRSDLVKTFKFLVGSDSACTLYTLYTVYIIHCACIYLVVLCWCEWLAVHLSCINNSLFVDI